MAGTQLLLSSAALAGGALAPGAASTRGAQIDDAPAPAARQRCISTATSTVSSGAACVLVPARGAACVREPAPARTALQPQLRPCAHSLCAGLLPLLFPSQRSSTRHAGSLAAGLLVSPPRRRGR